MVRPIRVRTYQPLLDVIWLTDEQVVTPTFYGGNSNYAVLQNSVFVGAETVSDGGKDGYFEVGVKISKVWPVNTTITIGNEYP